MAYVDLVMSFGIERALRTVFPAKLPPPKGYMMHIRELKLIEREEKE